MQPVEWELKCLAILRTMLSAQSQPWREELEEMYLYTLRSIGEEYGKRAVMHARTDVAWKWRPEPNELFALAADLASPLPSEGKLWSELWHKATHAEYAQPRWTHPFLVRLTEHLGGWRELRGMYYHDTERNSVEALRRRFEKACRELSDEWRRDVLTQIALPVEERDPAFFQKHTPFLPLASLPYSEETTYPAPTFKDFEAAMPDPGMLQDLKRITSRAVEKPVKKRLPAMDSVTRQAIEAELAARRPAAVEDASENQPCLTIIEREVA
jgi:hypothetical protein